ncbi:hypothetical protein D3C72_754220 [compost metagenome]
MALLRAWIILFILLITQLMPSMKKFLIPVHIPVTPDTMPFQTLEAAVPMPFHTPTMKFRILLPTLEIDEKSIFQIDTAVFQIDVNIELVEVQSSFHLVDTQATIPPIIPDRVAQIAAPQVTKNWPIEVNRFAIQAHAAFQTPINQVLMAPQFLKIWITPYMTAPIANPIAIIGNQAAAAAIPPATTGHDATAHATILGNIVAVIAMPRPVTNGMIMSILSLKKPTTSVIALIPAAIPSTKEPPILFNNGPADSNHCENCVRYGRSFSPIGISRFVTNCRPILAAASPGVLNLIWFNSPILSLVISNWLRADPMADIVLASRSSNWLPISATPTVLRCTGSSMSPIICITCANAFCACGPPAAKVCIIFWASRPSI